MFIYTLWVSVIALIYYLSASLGLLFEWQKGNANDIWSPAAIGFTAILFLGYRFWPGIWLGALMANIIFLLHSHFYYTHFSIILISLSVATGKTIGLIVGCFIFKKTIGRRNPLHKVQDFLMFILIGVVSCAINASIGSVTVYTNGWIPSGTTYVELWWIWLLQDLSGLLTLLPIFWVFKQWTFPKSSVRLIVEFAVSMAIFIFINEAMFNGKSIFSHTNLHISYLPLVLTVWLTYRFGYGGAVIANVMTLFIALKGTVNGFGPFASNDLNHSLFFLQLFITTLSGTSLLLAAALQERKLAEEILKNDLKQAARLADIGALAASVAHELRAPLHVVRMAVYNFKNKHKEFIEDKYLGSIEKKVDDSDRIINDLLSYSRIKMPSYGSCAILNLLDECVDNLEDQFQNSGITIEKDYQIKHDFVIEADSGLIQQVIINVLSNAYQAMEGRNGQIKLTMQKQGHEYLQISIKDSGVGIDPEDLEKIFRPFFTTKAKGTGLGLPICNEIINLHHGRLDIQSIKGEGTTANIILPVKRRIFG